LTRILTTTTKTRTVDPPTSLYHSPNYSVKVASRTYRRLARVFLNRRSSLPNPTLLLLVMKIPLIAQPHLVHRATVPDRAARPLVADVLEEDGQY
jgi:hypothetical protein